MKIVSASTESKNMGKTFKKNTRIKKNYRDNKFDPYKKMKKWKGKPQKSGHHPPEQFNDDSIDNLE